MTSRNHAPIVQILIAGGDQGSVDSDGNALPTLVYMGREKRSQHHHNFKAGAMNALIRASSEMSNSPVILNLDCDMYSNNSESIRDALCFFLDEENGHDIGFVQYPQVFDNITKSDLYDNSVNVITQITSPWFVPFAFVTIGKHVYGLVESLQCAKVSDGDASKRYEQEVMEFGSASSIFVIIASIAMLNLFCLVGGLRRLVVDGGIIGLEPLFIQILLCGLVVAIHLPIYEALFIRKDEGSLPLSVTFLSLGFAILASLLTIV
ncbi:hypothetical protein COCNU_11G005910 [Cocos nucifera]|uniref:Uncharacterized protein n=1 Tax=Cocos nucifera TaxID=13894 RepID=A0A8K0IQL3_COCNU|nr:hypothetical protein COCNU_11G005910 [Cocos nucifera]